MEQIYKILLYLHIVAGCGALIFGALAIIFKTNTPRHKKVGKIYFYCMSIIFVSAVVISIYKSLLFLFFIALFTYYATWIAYRALALKKLNMGQIPSQLDFLINGIAALSFLGLIIFAIVHFMQNKSIDALIPLAFGAMGLMGVFRNHQRLRSQPNEQLHWLKVHIGNMLGSYIGAITAFVVTQGEHIPLPQIVLWLGPTVVIMPIIFMELKKVKFIPIK